jgi:hypothetical protein
MGILKDIVSPLKKLHRRKSTKTTPSSTREQTDEVRTPMKAATPLEPDHTTEIDDHIPLVGSTAIQNSTSIDFAHFKDTKGTEIQQPDFDIAPDQVEHVARSPELQGEYPVEPNPDNLHPSRSTTGSESLEPNDRPMSVASDAPQPFPQYLHDEPAPLNETSDLHTPTSVPHRPSDTSAKQRYYEQEKTRDSIVPKDVLCYLHVLFGEKKIVRKHFQLDWQSNASYKSVDDAARQSLAKAPQTIGGTPYRTHGVCKLFEKDQEISSTALDFDYQWSEVLHLIIVRFLAIPGKEYAKFHLEITWTYASLDDSVKNPADYSGEIAQLIYAKRKKNWRNKKFIPRKDLDAIMSKSVISHLISNDDSLKKLETVDEKEGQAYDRKQFISEVQADGSKVVLLALCVYGDLPLICMWQMLKRPNGSAKLPLNESDRPDGASPRKFDDILTKQWYFRAHKFPIPKDSKVHCDNLEDDVILPIEPEHCDQLQRIGEGGFKEVFRVKIQPGHHLFTAVSSF